MALNHLWKVGLDDQRLCELGLSLGADVPVFIQGEAAWGEGVGERLQPIDLPEPWYLVVIPPCHVSTAEVFSDPQLTRNTPRMRIADFLNGGTRNDCLDVVVKNHPQVAVALEWLGRHGEARLTGTGACVFASFDDETDALRVREQLPSGYRGFVAKGVNRSPLKGFLESMAVVGG